MADVYLLKRDAGFRKKQNLIFIGDLSAIMAGYGLISCVKNNNYFLVTNSDLQRAIDLIKSNDIKPQVVDEDLASQVIFEIEKLENGESSSEGLSKKARELVSVIE